MPKLKLFCDACGQEFTVIHTKDVEVEYCPHCGSGIDKDWNSSEEAEE